MLLTGCSVLGSKEVTYGCQATDTITTIKALQAGAKEANPLNSKIISSFGIGGFIAAKIGAAFILNQTPDVVKAPINVAACTAAIHNIKVIQIQNKGK